MSCNEICMAKDEIKFCCLRAKTYTHKYAHKTHTYFHIIVQVAHLNFKCHKFQRISSNGF